jgi:hypothetical protein
MIGPIAVLLLSSVTTVHTAALDFAATLTMERPIVVHIVDRIPPTLTLADGSWAWAMRGGEEDPQGSCAIGFLPDAAESVRTIAHEICHCKYDWEIMTTTGTVWGTTVARRELAERRAGLCASWLVDRGWKARQERYEGRIPVREWEGSGGSR